MTQDTGAKQEPTTKAVPFTQFLMPNGRRQTILIDRPVEVADAALWLIAQGCSLEIEMLSDYTTISMEVMGPPGADGEDNCLAGDICPNGPEVPVHVDRMIFKAKAHLEQPS